MNQWGEGDLLSGTIVDQAEKKKATLTTKRNRVFEERKEEMGRRGDPSN